MLNTRILGGKNEDEVFYIYMKCNVYIGMLSSFSGEVMGVNSCILVQHVIELNSVLYF